MKRWVLALVSILVVTGCSLSDPFANPPDARPTSGFEAGPVGLINLWRVSGAAGESDQTWLRIDVEQAQLLRPCGPTYLSWRASIASFVAARASADGDCDAGQQIEWLDKTTGYRSIPAGFELVDADGTVQATLTVNGNPKARGGVSKDLTIPPVITDAVREAMVVPDGLPQGAPAVGPADLVGKWLPTGPPTATQPFLEFKADGSYSGSDGCNGAGGRWAVDRAGGLLATTGPTTMIACDGAQVHSWLYDVRAASIDGDDLVLYNKNAEEITQLTRG